jgi:virginiamycin A acetyltransferase
LYKRYPQSRGSVQRLILSAVLKMEGGEFYSETARRIFKDYHDVEIGMYTHGGCFAPGNFGRFTKIGRYCSIARDALAFNRNHPLEFKSTHAFFFNPELMFCDEDKIEYTPLSIGHDVWIGAGAKILPSVREIGTGAVIGTQAVVTRNVPPYAVVAGYPARVVRSRFSKDVIESLLESRWWEQDIEEIRSHLDEFCRPYEQWWRNGIACDRQEWTNHVDTETMVDYTSHVRNGLEETQ